MMYMMTFDKQTLPVFVIRATLDFTTTEIRIFYQFSVCIYFLCVVHYIHNDSACYVRIREAILL